MKKWEYRTIEADAHLSADQLNESFGLNGWELVSIIPYKIANQSNLGIGSDNEGKLIHTFKRALLVS